MSSYTLYFNTGASVSVKVEAENLEQAIEEGYNALPGSLCAHCSGWDKKWARDEGDFEFDENGYEVDGEYIDPSKTGAADAPEQICRDAVDGSES